MLAETICAAVSAAGLGIAALTAYRRRFLTAARITAYALVPIGLVLTGVVEWVSGTVFDPSVWIGFGLLGVSWLLFMTTRAVERRSLGGAGKPAKEPRAAKAPQGVRGREGRPRTGRRRAGRLGALAGRRIPAGARGGPCPRHSRG
ncbi:hypothetical protein GCM10020254_66880 [Streptomyces goshikiensis]